MPAVPAIKQMITTPQTLAEYMEHLWTEMSLNTGLSACVRCRCCYVYRDCSCAAVREEMGKETNDVSGRGRCQSSGRRGTMNKDVNLG